MNRFKKELIRHGYKLEHQYDWLPYEVQKNIYIDSVIVNSEKATVTMAYNVIVERIQFNRQMQPVNNY